MNDAETRAVGSSWESFEGTPAHQWLLRTLTERKGESEKAILEANPLDYVFRPLRYLGLWLTRRETSWLLEEISDLLERYRKQ